MPKTPLRPLVLLRVLALTFVLVAAVAGARRPPPVRYLKPADRVLVLYDGKDPGAGGKAMAEQRVGRVLGALKLPYTIRDVAEPLPDANAMADYRGIVTVFSDPEMVQARAFVSWLDRELHAGRRLVILGHFGAYRESTDQRWLDTDDVNRIFRHLGVIYLGQWTDDPSKLALTRRDDQKGGVLRADAPITLETSRHYLLFRKLADDVTPHVVVDRKDVQDGQSAVVFTSPRGGMALERYWLDPKGKEYVDTRAFLELALFQLGESRQSLRVLFVLDRETPTGHRMESNLIWVARYGRLDADFVHLQDLPRLSAREIGSYGAVVLGSDASPLLLRGKTLQDLERTVRERGTGLVSLFPTYRREWQTMLGIKKWGNTATRVRGLKYEADFFPGLTGLIVGGSSYASDPNAVELVADAQVLAVGADPKRPEWRGPPVLWRHRHGKGNVLFRNDTIVTQKEWRGTVLHMILQALPVGAAPVLATTVMYVDDCPQPMWDVKKPPIDAEFGLSDTDFYKTVFWPDLMTLARDFDLRYTFGLVFSYDDKTEPPFATSPFDQPSAKGVPTWMAAEAVRLGHEIALHGYNHQSLIHDRGYTSKGWPSRDRMVEALRVGRDAWTRLFGAGNLPFTYIAPNNHIHRAGKEAVRIAFPEIRVMSAQYLDEGDIEGGEWDTDPDVDHFMDFPRTASEFYFGPHNTQSAVDGIMLTGAWSHFVHPDDVYDPDRNGGMGWKQLMVAARQMLTKVRTSWPWLKSVTARDAYHALVNFRSGAFHTSLEDEPGGGKTIRVRLQTGSVQPTTFVLRFDPRWKLGPITGGRVVQAYPGIGYYYLEGQGPETRVRLDP